MNNVIRTSLLNENQYSSYQLLSGICTCNTGFGGATCGVDLSKPPVVIGDSANITCDGSCASVLINGNMFVEGSTLVCHFTSITVRIRLMKKGRGWCRK